MTAELKIYNFEEEHRETRPQSTKITAARLAEVEDIQIMMGTLAVRLQRLSEEEANGWTPGTPQTNRSHRVEPIEKLAEELTEAINLLEKLYS